EALFSALPNQAILRAELRRLFRWLKDRGVTAIVTAERGDGMLTRHGLEEYVSDCVILLDHRVIDQMSTRRLRVVKYRGSAHGTNEYPFLIDETGFSVMPVTSMTLDHEAPTKRMPTGIAPLDAMLGGQGLFRGSSVLISGSPGSGKTSISAHLIDAACARGERCLYFPFEESQRQILRNMRSIGLDLSRWVERGLLQYHAARPHLRGLEMHLAIIHKQIVAFQPRMVVLDPVSNLMDIGTPAETKAMLTRLIDFVKGHEITTVFTSLTSETDNPEIAEVNICSLMDTWLLVRNLEHNGERTRGLFILKSRGMGHSHQIREFTLTDHGAELRDVYTGPAGVLTGTARTLQEARDLVEQGSRHNELSRKQRELESKRQAMEAKIASLRAAYDAQAVELETLIEEGSRAETVLDHKRRFLGVLRDGATGNGSGKARKGVGDGHLRQQSRAGNDRKERPRGEAR
ncbi:MAG: circadian clock protein KaiC, partial [Nitrospira sp.]